MTTCMGSGELIQTLPVVLIRDGGPQKRGTTPGHDPLKPFPHGSLQNPSYLEWPTGGNGVQLSSQLR